MIEIIAGWHGFWQFLFLITIFYTLVKGLVIMVRGWPKQGESDE